MSSESKKSDFAGQLAELEAITAWFESDKVELGAAVSKFERGMELAAQLNKELEAIENRVEIIKAKFQGGELVQQAPAAAEDEPQLF